MPSVTLQLALGATTLLTTATLLTHTAAQSRGPALDLTVPPGFIVETVAAPPLVNRPIVADFDEEGRLYVADSSGSNDKVEKQLEERPHRIVRLEDTDGDGRFDTSVVFADRMMFPEGAMWFDGSLYVAAPPSIWKLTDTDGDGIADRREEWFEGKTLTACANDLHGPYLGPDGWIYWTKGAFAEQTYDRPGRAPLVSRAAHVLRRRPGHPGVEVVMTGGMDNPVEIAFTPEGERILTATFLEHPQLGRRDALVHAVYGGVYGKQHSVVDGHQRTGDLMPVMTQLGPAVPSGLARYASRVFGEEYRDSFFATMFNLQKVTRHVLERDGATYRTRDSDFLVSSNRDFHPTDVLEDADGSLLVIDTGPWYKLCCPTSQLAKPDVPGAIYRVRRVGARTPPDPRGRQLAWRTMGPGALTKLLADERPAVRARALHQLSQAGADAAPALREALGAGMPLEMRRNAVWGLTRVEGSSAREAVRTALEDADESVRIAALHSVGLWRDRLAQPSVTRALRTTSAPVQRAAAEALGRLADSTAAGDLIGAAASADDPVLAHSLTYALIEIGDPSATAAGLQSSSSRARRAALVALDQMDVRAARADVVLPLLRSSDVLLRDTAWWIAEGHPEWGDGLAAFFERELQRQPESAADRDLLRDRLARFSDSAAVQALLARAAEGTSGPDARALALRAMAAAPAAAPSRMKVQPASWTTAVIRALADEDAVVSGLAIAAVRAAPGLKGESPDVLPALMRLARDSRRPVEIRLDAMAAMPAGTLDGMDDELFAVVRAGLGSGETVSSRALAASIVERVRLQTGQLEALVRSLDDVGPLELPRVVRAFAHGTDERLGLELVAGLGRSRGRSAIRGDLLRPIMAKYPESVRREGNALLADIHLDSAGQAERLETLMRGMGGGDIRRGQAVFNSEKAACASCHAIGYLGGRIGPDLTRIGEVRSERDLLEAIVFPSVSFARSYEPMMVVTRSGEVHSGVLRSEQPAEVVIGTAAGEEIRIARQEIREMQPGDVSLMPAGLDAALTNGELADLLAFLKATRWGPD